MEWTREKCLDLIELYERYPVLWNPKHEQHYNKIKKNDAWILIAEKVGCTSEEARKKMDILLASFRREKIKLIKSRGTAKGTDEIYVSKWFGFSRMVFLLDRDEPKTARDSVEEVYIESVNENNEEVKETLTNFTINEAELQIPSPETSKSKRKATVAVTSATPMRKRKRQSISEDTDRRSSDDAKVDEALGILKIVAYNVTSDACGVYGQHVAFKLRSYTRTTRNIVEHHINNILFKADMGHYSYTVTPPVHHQSIPQSPSAYSSQATSNQTPLPTPSPQHQTASAHSVKFEDFDNW
ncbi:uncharacterized protein LOC114335176 [Diabrotica virgifera virgifera]|uniref:Uncharacterized protein LOC114335176 n=1 Tax=Diabrotica virgifera virgifera TaxID=50390 RepID=A0A6P7G9J3_DIAVI|nr:uncharacterized protein LOC114335176 [Diabrotica virgifera virgifera]